MAGTFVGKVLADGTIANSKGTIYTVPASTVAYLKSLSLFNENAASQTVILYINSSGTSRKWRRYVLAQNESVEVLSGGETIILEAADLIEAETTTTSAVPFTLTGIQET